MAPDVSPSPSPVLYRIRLQYCITVEAVSHTSAYEKAKTIIAKEPGSVISAVEDASLARPRPLWKRFLTGR